MNKSKIEEYDQSKAIKTFTIAKFAEIFLIFLLIFGPYFLGAWVNSRLVGQDCGFGLTLDLKCHSTQELNFLNLWWIGLEFLLLMLLSLIIWFVLIIACLLVIFLAGYGVYSFFRLNWEWAKKSAETPEGKEKRLRKDWKILEGDTVKIRKNLEIGKYYEDVTFVKKMKPYEGKSAKVVSKSLGDYGHPLYRLNIDKAHYYWSEPMLMLKKERKFKEKIEGEL